MLSAIDKDRIEAAVRTAEAGTSGEIVCLLAQEVSNYREVPLAWAAAVALPRRLWPSLWDFGRWPPPRRAGFGSRRRPAPWKASSPWPWSSTPRFRPPSSSSSI